MLKQLITKSRTGAGAVVKLLRQVVPPDPWSTISTLAQSDTRLLSADIVIVKDGQLIAVNETFCSNTRRSLAEELIMMSSYYHPAKEAEMAAMTEPLCLERGKPERLTIIYSLIEYMNSKPVEAVLKGRYLSSVFSWS